MLNRFTARRFRKDSDGNVAMMTALAMVVLLMGAGAAVDYSLLSNQSSSLQNVSDAAVLAAATSGETDEGKLLEIAQSVIELHHPDAENLSVAVKLVEGIVVVDVTSTREVIMKGFFGDDPKPISVRSASPMPSSGPVNMALVLDTTGSMAGSNIIALKLATTSLLNTLETAESETHVSIVPFGQYVNVGYQPANTDNRNWIDRKDEGDTEQECWTNWWGNQSCYNYTVTWNGCMGTSVDNQRARRAATGVGKLPAAYNEFCGSEIMPLSNDFTAMRAKIASLTTGGTTYLPSGLVWGWRTLERQKPYTEAKDIDTDNLTSAMVFMTDGANNRSRGNDGYDSSGPKHRYYADGGAGGLQLTKDLCDGIKADGIKIYVVAYQLSHGSTTSTTLKDCASDDESFFEPDNSQQLIDTFDNIASSVNEARLVYHTDD